MSEKYFLDYGKLPVFLNDGIFIFPFCSTLINLEKHELLRKILINSWKFNDGKILVLSSNSSLNEKELKSYDSKKFFEFGSIAKIETVLSKDANIDIIFNSFREVQLVGVDRVKISNFEYSNDAWYAEYQIIRENPVNNQNFKNHNEEMKRIDSLISSLLQKTSTSAPYLVFNTEHGANSVLDFFVQNNNSLGRDFKQLFLEEYRFEDRLKLLTDLDRKIRKFDNDIKKRTNERIANQQTNIYLSEQMRSIKEQINLNSGSRSKDQEILREFEKNPYPEHVRKYAKDELKNYENLSHYSPESGMILNHLEWLISIPWFSKEKDESIVDLKFEDLRKTLNKDHFGLEKPKQKIIEYFAVIKNINDRNKEFSKEDETK
ncbi:MAG TPA: LON peptidase substrate-binding domain-containing protein [Mycoplasmatales bacterium]|jgi:ATP-dependent Lon protease|nr:LON peptidase substrate-binding domain-containing protein [Mycoplasmatales bacterium]